jgi:competence protein ComEC
MRSTIIGFVAGASLLQIQASLPSWPIIWTLLFAALLFAMVAYSRRASSLRLPAAAACGVLLGFAWAAVVAQHYLSRELPAEWEGRDVTVVGTIDSLPDYFGQGVRFDFAVEKVLPSEGKHPVVPSRLALSWYSGFHAEESQTAATVQPGERWQLTVRMKRPHGNANLHGFDYEAWLLEQNVRATGSVRPDRDPASRNQRLDTFVFSIGNGLQRVRGWMRDRIHAALPGKEYAGVIVALVIGDQRAISQSDWKVFNRTGIGHLVSISGLHITMIAGMFAGLVFALWRRSFFSRAALPTLLPAQKAAALAGAGAALAYVALAGFGIPAQRTLYMLSVVALALWLGRITSVSHVLCAALGAVVVLDPWAVMWPGFWLSFGAVATILYATTGRTQSRAEEPPVIGPAVPSTDSARWLGSLRAAAHVQYVVTLGLVPLTMLLFGQVSLVSPIANAFAIPLVSFIVTPLALAGSVLPSPFSAWLLQAAHWCVAQLALALGWLSELPAAVWMAPVPSWWIFLLATTGTLWMLAPRGWPLRWFGLAGWLPLLLNAPTHPEANEVWITAFDVGQGTAVLIETSQHRLLYDTGPAYSPDADGGNRVILPYLKGRGVTRLDAVIVSHSDTDHSGGALSIFDEILVGWVLSSLPADHPMVRAAPGHRRCETGQSWSWDGVRFEMLHPSPVSYTSTKWKPNARSCTLKITAGKHSILLPGDIEAVQETELVESSAAQLQASVLLAPHHGSGTSSTAPFLGAVKPGIVVFQVGYRNRYRHPRQDVYERYGELGIRRLRTDETGAVDFRFGTDLSFTEFRDEHRRYWHGR